MTRPTARRVAVAAGVTVAAVAALYAAGMALLVAWLCVEVRDREGGVAE